MLLALSQLVPPQPQGLLAHALDPLRLFPGHLLLPVHGGGLRVPEGAVGVPFRAAGVRLQEFLNVGVEVEAEEVQEFLRLVEDVEGNVFVPDSPEGVRELPPEDRRRDVVPDEILAKCLWIVAVLPGAPVLVPTRVQGAPRIPHQIQQPHAQLLVLQQFLREIEPESDRLEGLEGEEAAEGRQELRLPAQVGERLTLTPQGFVLVEHTLEGTAVFDQVLHFAVFAVEKVPQVPHRLGRLLPVADLLDAEVVKRLVVVEGPRVAAHDTAHKSGS